MLFHMWTVSTKFITNEKGITKMKYSDLNKINAHVEIAVYNGISYFHHNSSNNEITPNNLSLEDPAYRYEYTNEPDSIEYRVVSNEDNWLLAIADSPKKLIKEIEQLLEWKADD